VSASQTVDPTSERPSDPTRLIDPRELEAALVRQLLAHGADPLAAELARKRWRYGVGARGLSARGLTRRLRELAEDALAGHRGPGSIRTQVRADHAATTRAAVGNVLVVAVELAAAAGEDPEEASRCYCRAVEDVLRDR